MLRQATAKPRRFTPCGFAGTPSVGALFDVTAGAEPSQGQGRRR